MLISFAATNHRSLRDRCELSLVAENHPTVDRARLPVPGFDLEVVPVVALLGANGSGKSNILDALHSAGSAVTHSQTTWSPTAGPRRDPFQTREGPSSEPTVFEITFTIEQTVYEYEFALGYEVIESERLFSSERGPRSRTRLFERTTSRDRRTAIRFGRRLRGSRASAEAATRPNSLFLSSAAQNNHELLTEVWQSLSWALRVATPSNRAARENYTAQTLAQADPKFHKRVQQFLISADLGIRDVSVRERPLDAEIVQLARTMAAALDRHDLPLEEHRELVTTFSHRGDVGRIDFEEESAGTKAWFAWAAPILNTLDGGSTIGADELDSHLNEQLAAKIVESFQDPDTNPYGAQLIFAAQNPHVTSRCALGRDQVWITEKDETGATDLIPVTDYSPRREWDLANAYRSGRFGGLPVLDEEAFLASLLDRDRNG